MGVVANTVWLLPAIWVSAHLLAVSSASQFRLASERDELVERSVLDLGQTRRLLCFGCLNCAPRNGSFLGSQGLQEVGAARFDPGAQQWLGTFLQLVFAGRTQKCDLQSFNARRHIEDLCVMSPCYGFL